MANIAKNKKDARTADIQRERDMEKGAIIRSLQLLYNSVSQVPHDFVDDESLKNLGIEVEKFDMTNDPDAGSDIKCFFKPLSQSEVDKIPFAPDEDTQSNIKSKDRVFETYINDNDNAYGICSQLGFRSSFLPRDAKLNDNRRPARGYSVPSLSHLQGWQSIEYLAKYMLDQRFSNTVWSTKGYPVYSWERIDKKEKPHVMFALQHRIGGDDRLLRGELLCILAIMQGIMPHSDFEKHLVFPILVFSFMGARGRIIQAHYEYNYRSLDIRKSVLLDFTDKEKALNNMDHFIRYAASTPIGDTKLREDSPLDTDSEGEPCEESPSEDEDDWEIITATQGNQG